NPDFNPLADTIWAFLSRFTLPTVRKPLTANVTASDKLKLAHRKAAKDAPAWRITLGDGTWSADDGKDIVLAGSASRKKNKFVISLTSAARATLLDALNARAAAIVGSPVTFQTNPPEHLQATVDGKMKKAHLMIKLKLADTGGATAGTYNLSA